MTLAAIDALLDNNENLNNSRVILYIDEFMKITALTHNNGHVTDAVQVEGRNT